MNRMQNAYCSKNVGYYCYCNEKQLNFYCVKRPHPSPKDLTIPGGTQDKCWNGGIEVRKPTGS